jgi:hypothetical protein
MSALDLLADSSIAHANPLLSSLSGLGMAALGTGGGILGSSSSATGTQGNTSIFASGFQVGGRGNSTASDPTVSPTVATTTGVPSAVSAPLQAIAAAAGGAGNLGLIIGVVGVIVGVVALLKR